MSSRFRDISILFVNLKLYMTSYDWRVLNVGYGNIVREKADITVYL